MRANELGNQIVMPDGLSGWEKRRDDAMFHAIKEKFKQPQLRDLLLSTHPHKLASLKADPYWGTGFDGRGVNKLGELLVALREEIRDSRKGFDCEASV